MNVDTMLKMFRLVCDAAGICFWDWDLRSGEMVFQNFRNFFRTGHDHNRLTLEEWEAYVLPEDLEEVRAEIGNCLEGGRENYVATMRMRLGDGSLIWAQDRGWVVERRPDGEPVRLMGLQQDITHIKDMERDLHGKQAQLDVIADISGLVPWEWDAREKRLSVGPQFFREFGYSDEESRLLLDTDWLSIVHPDDAARVRKAVDDYMSGEADGYRVELRMRRQSGEYIWCLSSGVVSERRDGAPARLVGGILNIDHLKRVEEDLSAALKENKKFTERLQRENAITEENLRLSEGNVFRQRRLLSVVNDIAMDMLHVRPEDIDQALARSLKKVGQSVNADRVYIMRNVERDGEAGIERLHGWNEDSGYSGQRGSDDYFSYSQFSGWEETLKSGKFINVHVHTLPQPQKGFFENRGIQSVLVLPVHVDDVYWGVIYFGDSNRVRLSDDQELKTLQSSGVLMVLSLMRASAMMRLQKAMEEAQASTRAKTMILANVSHEMKTPLNAILGMSAIAMRRPEKVGESLSRIDEAARRLLGVIVDLLDVASLESGTVTFSETPFTVSGLLDAVAAKNGPAALAKGLELACNAGGLGGRAFLADAGRLERVLNCLVDNAVKFTPEGGRVEVCVHETEKIARGRSLVRLSVRDNGIGIDENVLPGLFLPFEQMEKRLARSFEGAGLGLGIAKGIIEAMGGSISAQSEPGAGSVFSISLPLCEAAGGAAGRNGSSLRRAGAGARCRRAAGKVHSGGRG